MIKYKLLPVKIGFNVNTGILTVKTILTFDIIFISFYFTINILYVELGGKTVLLLG